MGWVFSPSWNRKSLIQDRIQSWSSKDSEFSRDKEEYTESKCLKHCYRGAIYAGTLWTVWEVTHRKKSDDSIVKSERYIGCDLLECRGREWGYKDMDESMGPYKHNCPLSYLDMVPCPDGYAEEWRKGVYAYHQNMQERREAKKAHRPLIVSQALDTLQ